MRQLILLVEVVCCFGVVLLAAPQSFCGLHNPFTAQRVRGGQTQTLE
jgi:ABC-type enterobactin transport system permease subunit